MAQANAALRKLPDDIALEVRTVTGTTAYRVATDAAAAVPVGDARHGIHLRDAIRWKWTGRLAATVYVMKAAFHWRFLEFGTRRRSPLAMFRKAKDRNAPDHHSRLMGALERANRRMGS